MKIGEFAEKIGTFLITAIVGISFLSVIVKIIFGLLGEPIPFIPKDPLPGKVAQFVSQHQADDEWMNHFEDGKFILQKGDRWVYQADLAEIFLGSDEKLFFVFGSVLDVNATENRILLRNYNYPDLIFDLMTKNNVIEAVLTQEDSAGRTFGAIIRVREVMSLLRKQLITHEENIDLEEGPFLLKGECIAIKYFEDYD